MKNAVIIYTVGKVGSTSVYEACKQHVSDSIYHIHNLVPEAVQAQIRASKKQTGTVYRHLEHSMEILQQVLPVCKQLKIINIVRGPVARTISHYFTNSPMLNPKLQSPRYNGECEPWFVRAKYLSEANHLQILNWHRSEFQQATGINLLKEFDKETGYCRLINGGVDLLSFQYEQPDSVKAELLSDFFGVPIKEMPRSNQTSKKEFGDNYQKILQQLKLDPEYLDFMYTSKYARSFYSDAQIETHRRKWQGSF